MKKLFWQLLFIVLLTILFTCGCWMACPPLPGPPPPGTTIAEGPGGVTRTVTTLFTHDGITVYRFVDKGHYVYFTSRGDVQSEASTGKVTTPVQTIAGHN